MYIFLPWLQITGALSAGELRYIECRNVHVGRFVAVYFDHPGVLSVCELEVYGGRLPKGICQNIISMNEKQTKKKISSQPNLS